MPKSLPDTVWISERPGDRPAGEEFLVSTHEPTSGNPEPFVRKAKADRLARALKYAQDALGARTRCCRTTSYSFTTHGLTSPPPCGTMTRRAIIRRVRLIPPAIAGTVSPS